MPDRIARDPALALPALETLAVIANDNIAQAGAAGGNDAEKLRYEAAARVLLAARRVHLLVGAADAARPQAEPLVDSLAAGWDPRAVTALEYAESLPLRALDGLLRAAPRWARAMQDLIEPGAAAA